MTQNKILVIPDRKIQVAIRRSGYKQSTQLPESACEGIAYTKGTSSFEISEFFDVPGIYKTTTAQVAEFLVLGKVWGLCYALNREYNITCRKKSPAIIYLSAQKKELENLIDDLTNNPRKYSLRDTSIKLELPVHNL